MVQLRVLLRPFLFVFQCFARIFWSGLNKRSIIGLFFNFWINFSPVFIWLAIFKNAGLIPKHIRPRIHVKLAYMVDEYMFNCRDNPVGSVGTVAFTWLLAWGLYRVYYKGEPEKIQQLQEEETPYSSSSSASSDIELDSWSNLETGKVPELPLMGIKWHKSDPTEEPIYRPKNSWYLAPVLLLASSWFLLNLCYVLREPITLEKDMFAWSSYVLGHILAPIFTAIWLYVFHAPGALKLFSIAMGCQNIAGVLTHLLFPNAAPWFIHLNGADASADYDMPAYAAGLTRVDAALGTHLNSAGFHASPIVFGALPSLHSAMAVQVCFFICYYSRWTVLKLVAISFVAIQWWATIYLDHHWRLDLMLGMLYSIALYTLLMYLRVGFRRVDERFIRARSQKDFVAGTTMGMRVFHGTFMESFFDPLS